MGMSGFRDVGSTDFQGISAAEIRAIGRAVSGSGIDADARAIGQTGTTHVMSLAELERDIGTIAPRWTGEAAEKSYLHAGRFVRASSELGLEFGRTVKQMSGLSRTAHRTNQRFSELTDVPAVRGRATESVGTKVAAELRSTYTAPVQADASTMPLGAEVAKVSYDFKPRQQRDNRSSGGSPEEEDGPSVGGGDGSGGGSPGNGSGASTPEADPAGTVDNGATKAIGETSDEAGADAGAGQGTGGTGTGTEASGGGSDAGTDPSVGAGDGTTSDDSAAYDPTAETEQPSLLSPAATVPVGAGGRSSGGGLSGVRGGAGQVASPLGLRQDTAVARSTPAPTGTGTTTATGARPSGPYGMPAAGAGAQRGQGDGRHRLPAYLIDRKNGEELVGDLPLVGPGVIGQWKSDGPPDAARTAAPPARAEPRPR